MARCLAFTAIGLNLRHGLFWPGCDSGYACASLFVMATGSARFQQKAMHGSVVLNLTSYAKSDLQSYARAYHEAANSLVQVFRGKAGYSDAEACPIVFL